jgi:hypothetical protein
MDFYQYLVLPDVERCPEYLRGLKSSRAPKTPHVPVDRTNSFRALAEDSSEFKRISIEGPWLKLCLAFVNEMNRNYFISLRASHFVLSVHVRTPLRKSSQ